MPLPNLEIYPIPDSDTGHICVEVPPPADRNNPAVDCAECGVIDRTGAAECENCGEVYCAVHLTPVDEAEGQPNPDSYGPCPRCGGSPGTGPCYRCGWPADRR